MVVWNRAPDLNTIPDHCAMGLEAFGLLSDIAHPVLPVRA
jgi:hypothetical protein